AAFETFNVTAQGRYLRIVGAGSTVDRANSYKEVQVFAEATLARLRPVSVVGSAGTAPAWAVVDDDANTHWLGAGAGAHLVFDWGAVREVKQLRIAFYNGNARMYGLQVQVSADGQT